MVTGFDTAGTAGMLSTRVIQLNELFMTGQITGITVSDYFMHYVSKGYLEKNLLID